MSECLWLSQDLLEHHVRRCKGSNAHRAVEAGFSLMGSFDQGFHLWLGSDAFCLSVESLHGSNNHDAENGCILVGLALCYRLLRSILIVTILIPRQSTFLTVQEVTR